MHLRKILLSTAIFAVMGAALSMATPTPQPVGLALTRPAPVKVVSPMSVPAWAENTTVKVALTVDAHGVPHDLSTVGRVPYELASRVLTAVAKWTFTPAYENGHAVSTRVVLPITLVVGELQG